MTDLYAPIKLIIADDHELIRDGFRVMTSRLPELEVIGEAENGEELVQLTMELQPDVVITDIVMPKMDGIQATRKIKSAFPHIGVIALSMFDDENLIIDMLEAGAKGYLIKNAHKNEIIEAVKTVYREKAYYCNHTSLRLAQMIANSRYNPYRKCGKPQFSEREMEIIRLITEGLISKEIADRLNLRPRTIESHREKIMEKMEVNNIAGLIVYAVKNGLVKLNQ